MKKSLPILFILALIVSLAQAQQLSLQAGQTFSKIQFEDSNGNELENLNAVNRFFMMAEYRSPVFAESFKSRLLGTIGINFNGYGATGSDPALDNYYEWDLSYLGLVLGLDYEFYEIGRFTGFVNVKVSSELLVRGSQVINSQTYDVKGEDDFDTPITFFRGGLGAKFQLTTDASIFAQYTIGKSYSFFDSGASELNIVAQNFGIGLFADILTGANKKPKRH